MKRYRDGTRIRYWKRKRCKWYPKHCECELGSYCVYEKKQKKNIILLYRKLYELLTKKV